MRTVCGGHAASRQSHAYRERQSRGRSVGQKDDLDNDHDYDYGHEYDYDYLEIHNADNDDIGDARADDNHNDSWLDDARNGSVELAFGDDHKLDGLDEIVNVAIVGAKRLPKTKHRGAPKIKISWGELVDRYTIIRLKLLHATDSHRLAPLQAECRDLQPDMDWFLENVPGAGAAYKKIELVNAQLWKLENKVRVLMRAGDAGPIFAKTAQSIFLNNQKRSALKAAVNKLAGTGIEEVKIYQLD